MGCAVGCVVGCVVVNAGLNAGLNAGFWADLAVSGGKGKRSQWQMATTTKGCITRPVRITDAGTVYVVRGC